MTKPVWKISTDERPGKIHYAVFTLSARLCATSLCCRNLVIRCFRSTTFDRKHSQVSISVCSRSPRRYICRKGRSLPSTVSFVSCPKYQGSSSCRLSIPLFQTTLCSSYCPIQILQGSLDPIVPPAQAEAIVKVLRDQGGNVEYTVFEGEGHGWREAKNIESALEKEALFYSKVFRLGE